MFFIAALLIFGSCFCFAAWVSTNFTSAAWFIGIISLFFCAIISAALSTLKNEFKEQEKRIKELEEQLNTNNEKTGD